MLSMSVLVRALDGEGKEMPELSIETVEDLLNRLEPQGPIVGTIATGLALGKSSGLAEARKALDEASILHARIFSLVCPHCDNTGYLPHEDGETPRECEWPGHSKPQPMSVVLEKTLKAAQDRMKNAIMRRLGKLCPLSDEDLEDVLGCIASTLFGGGQVMVAEQIIEGRVYHARTPGAIPEMNWREVVMIQDDNGDRWELSELGANGWTRRRIAVFPDPELRVEKG